MRIAHLTIAAAGLAVLLCACERRQDAPPPPAPEAAPAPEPAPPPAETLTGFEHQPGFDASGYYLTESPVGPGSWRLRAIAVGTPSDFEQWEEGSREVFGPIMVDFEDAATPAQTNEMGGQAHAGQARVKPTAYRFGPGEVYFRGHAPEVGEVVFSGSFDEAALAAARQSGSSGGKPVLSGSLAVGGDRIRNISFHYWAGD